MALALSLVACGADAPQSETRTVYAMDTVMNLTVYGKNASAALEGAEGELHTFDKEVLSPPAERSRKISSPLRAVSARARASLVNSAGQRSARTPKPASTAAVAAPMTANFWEPVMRRGIITFPRPEECPLHKPLGDMKIKPFGERLNNFAGLREFGEVT